MHTHAHTHVIPGSVTHDLAGALVELADELAHVRRFAQRLVVEHHREAPRYRQIDVENDDLRLETRRRFDRTRWITYNAPCKNNNYAYFLVPNQHI